MGFFKNLFKSEEERLQEKAEAGDVDAMITLGQKYEHGAFDGTPQYHLAYKWYKAAADTGNAVAINNVGWCYERGYGVKVDLAKARELYEQAYEKGDWHGASNLSSIYMAGKGVPVDEEKAIPYMTFAAQHGDPHCLYNLAVFYLSGNHVQKDVTLANELMSAAAQAGHPQAIEVMQHANGDLSTLQIVDDPIQAVINEYNQGNVDKALSMAHSLGDSGNAEGYYLFAQLINAFTSNSQYMFFHNKEKGNTILAVLREGQDPAKGDMNFARVANLPSEVRDQDLADLIKAYVKKAADMGHPDAQGWMKNNTKD